MTGKIHIGTSGWSYKHWRERFYPQGLPANAYLDYYAQYFGTTEINTSFYHLPKPGTVANWMKTVKAKFRFCPKISRYITHVKKLNDPEQTLPRFFDVFKPFKKKLGPVLIQLPPNLAFNEEKTTHFFSILKQYKGYHFAFEARHESWFTPEALSLLRKFKITFVIADAGKRWPSASELTARHVYIRFHGKTGYDSLYSTQQINSYAKKMLLWKQEGHIIWAFFNNDGNACAIKNALQLITQTNEKINV
ncbi:DUF72 domain-containing protein [Filimonas effusa]|uniref:DUF72 domain-containing protein n=1 Tax=Filimonas effusa TaxID=2508721 RepID=A0A4Q1DBY0_9BACT|nr:DUF72 domain-containing protein [Filimonas effusa]RXK86448.1 DUF72 domain-containing protein [Filimonas effusa]